MPRLQTTIGQLLVNSVLPEDLQDYERVIDKNGLKDLLSQVAEKYPDRYREISFALSRIGRQVADSTGGNSFGLKHMRQAKSARLARQQLQVELDAIDDDDSLSDEARDKKVLLAVGRLQERQGKEIYDESLAEGNPLARQVLSGSRGSPMNLASLRGSDLLYSDHRHRILPLPVLRSYAQGLSPAEYWAGSYGARKGTMDTKFATQDAGFLSKQLNQIAHRAMVTGEDDPVESPTLRGFPTDTDDPDNEGSLLASPMGGYDRNTPLTPKILADLRRQKIKRILVRSPTVGGTADGGVYARDVGMREFGRLPVSGENVGLTAAQALSEPLSQAQLSSKHGGGVAGSASGKATSGFETINQLIQTPKTFKGGAAHATNDGTVEHIEEAPQGGQYVQIDGNRHYVGAGFKLLVKPNDKIEAGDVISEGMPNPATVVQYKGVGEGRRYFVQAFRQAFRDAGIKGHRRNMELLARGLINHVRLTDEIGDFAPDDVVPYSVLESRYNPREGTQEVEPREAVGRYLERPYLHYSIGTKVRPSMLQNFTDFGVGKVAVHADDPPFQPEMIRGMNNLQHDPDWITRMFGSGLKSSLLKGVHRGGHSDELGTSFVPGLAKSVQFGQVGKVITPQPKRDDRLEASKQLKVGEDVLSDRAGKLRAALKQAELSEQAQDYLLRKMHEATQVDPRQRSGLETAVGVGAGFNPMSWIIGNSDGESDYRTNYASPSGSPYPGDPRVELPNYSLSVPERYRDEWAQQRLLPNVEPKEVQPTGLANPENASLNPLTVPLGWAGMGPTPTDQQYVDRYNEAIRQGLPPDKETVRGAFEAIRRRHGGFEQALNAKLPELYGQPEPEMPGTLPDAPPPGSEGPASTTQPQPIPASDQSSWPSLENQWDQIRGEKPQTAHHLLPQPPPPSPQVAPQPATQQPTAQPAQAAPATAYRAGFGLLPIAQMADQLAPGVTQQMLQSLGPVGAFGLPALIDSGALTSLTRGGAGPRRPAAPAQRPVALSAQKQPVPAAQPATKPQALPQMPKPVTPATPAQPMKPAKPIGKPAVSTPQSIVPGG